MSRKTELQERLDAYRQRASEKAMMSLLSDSTSSSAAESIWLTIGIEQKEYSFALKSAPVKLTYTTNTYNRNASIQKERYQPSALVPMQDMQWQHSASSSIAEGHPTGGTPIRCTVVRSNKAKNAEAPIRVTVEGNLRWQQQPTRLSLQGQGWIFQFHYSLMDGRLRLIDAEYDTEMGETAILSMQRLANATKRKSESQSPGGGSSSSGDETALALAQFKDQKHAIEHSAPAKRQKLQRSGEAGEADEAVGAEEEEDESDPQ